MQQVNINHYSVCETALNNHDQKPKGKLTNLKMTNSILNKDTQRWTIGTSGTTESPTILLDASHTVVKIKLAFPVLMVVILIFQKRRNILYGKSPKKQIKSGKERSTYYLMFDRRRLVENRRMLEEGLTCREPKRRARRDDRRSNWTNPRRGDQESTPKDSQRKKRRQGSAGERRSGWRDGPMTKVEGREVLPNPFFAIKWKHYH